MKFVCFLLMAFSTNIARTVTFCGFNNSYIIRNPKSGLVLDSTGAPNNITIQYFDGFSPQLWNFECGDAPGLFHIVQNGKALDINKNTDPNQLILNKRDYSLYQQWFINFDGTIVNAAVLKYMYIYRAILTPGNYVEVYQLLSEGSYHDAQIFSLQEKL